ncbi:tetratricopeptide repeat protein [Clostridium sp. MSJ-11]|uniref:Tetratricopeptide repeat protein n=1 Tax=Clostridium mobile TaxID=2841512 RepID=A0ABS6EIP6_9CLOT|nr:tetratricopeptide repeat protein [Clostridium mobile]MBU5485085.1 tetratricopeptide repeat protein [Clostridium mobile]
MDKSQKAYNKALEKYNKGYINDSMDLCEKSISLNLNNSAAINLKGLLYYISGDLQGSKSLWKMNVHVNKDSVAKKYLEDSKKDDKLLSIYNTAIVLIKEMKINEALIMLKECSNSHFNYINVNNYLALCYMKKGDYLKALEHINNVLGTDRNNKIALQSKKEITRTGVVKKDKIKMMPLIILLVILVSITSIVLVIKNNSSKIVNNNKNNLNKNKTEDIVKNKTEDKIEDKTETGKSPKEEIKEEIIKEKPVEKFPYEELKSYIDNKNYDKVYEIIKKWDKKELGINEKSIFGKGKELLLTEGREAFYTTGYSYYEKMEYDNAKDYLMMAYEYGADTWYYSHSIYILALCYEQIGNIKEAIKYYTIYDESFDKGEYKEIVLYNLCLLYKNIDIDKSKHYANRVIEEYPNTIYNNSKVQDIINNNY